MRSHPDPFVQQVHSFIATHATHEAAQQDTSGVLRIVRDMYSHSLRHAFNSAANPHHEQPALALAARRKLRDIGGDYMLPRGLNAPTLEAYAMTVLWTLRHGHLSYPQAHGLLTDVATRYERLNPILTTLSYDRSNIHRCYDMVMGVTSGFNTDDIQFFLDGNYYSSSMKNPAYAEKFAVAASTLRGDSIHWVPSPKTLDRIIAQKRHVR